MSYCILLSHCSYSAYLFIVVAASEDHRDRDCFGVAVLSHGDDIRTLPDSGRRGGVGDILYGTDEAITIDKLLNPIKDCTSLAGKPKICIFQVGC